MDNDSIGNCSGNPAWDAIVARIGPPPMTPIGNVEWANNAATALAFASLTLPLDDEIRERIKLFNGFIDRVGLTQNKAIVSREIRDLQKKAGISKDAKPDAARLVPVNGGGAIRAAGRLQRGNASARPVPDLPPEEDA